MNITGEELKNNKKLKTMDQGFPEFQISIIRPGIVLLRKILNEEDQIHMIDIVTRHGGLKNEEGKWNFFDKRGRTFDALSNYPAEDEAFIRSCFERMRLAVEKAPNAEIPIAGCTHILTWWYPDQKGMGWHIDGYGGNDGDEDAPVYSLTLGNTCVFEWNPIGPEDKVIESANIESGDVIIFGGPQRMMRHRVKKVILKSFRNGDFDVRINITFRKLSEFTMEDEKAFQTDAYEQRMRESFAKKN